MIPIRLELKNFLPYRSPDPIRFDGVHLACLTGSNGAGKSSLLDAITWALWGKARARRDEDLVHLGQGDMWVQLDFEQEGTIYRVLRRRTRGKRSGQGALDLFVMQEDDTPTTITEPGMNLTQQKINDILRLDYETFVHSAFLQQGKADAFTVKRPAERKKILSDILSLDQWSKYEDVTKERLKEINNRLSYYTQRIDEINHELERKPTLERELVTAQEGYEAAEAARIAAEERLKEVEDAPGDLRAANDRKADQERQLRDNERELDAVEDSIRTRQQQIDRYQQVIASRQEIEAGYAALTSAREASQELSDKLRQMAELRSERSHIENQIANARTRLEGEISGIEKRIADFEEALKTDYSSELDAVQGQVSGLQEQEIERNRLDEAVQSQREELARETATLEAITNEGKILRERLDRLQATDAEAVACPLCGQPLTSEHRDRLVDELSQEVADRREQYRQYQERINTLEAEIDSGRGQITKLDRQLKKLPPLIERIGTLQNQVQTAQDAADRLQEARAELAQLQADLDAATYAQPFASALTELDGRQAELDYDESSHNATRDQLEANKGYDQLNTQLQIALQSIESLQDAMKGDEERKARLLKIRDEIADILTNIASEIEQLKVKVEDYHQRKQAVETERLREKNTYERLTIAQQNLKALADQEKRKQDLETKLAAAREEDALYSELRQAFGKNGVPAMIIETAIPELEAEANELLTRMTDGRMHLRLKTQRETVAGDMTETLDIEIADELGTRNYEMYSGGEAFRINFAIRVALSQMLARRAGAHLRTLFIDEGFGTQDDQGRAKLVEAINAIQDAFDLILVITHIDELRDSFPVHIVVDKTPNGSRIALR